MFPVPSGSVKRARFTPKTSIAIHLKNPNLCVCALIHSQNARPDHDLRIPD
jgi:hypothetical protein